MRTLVNDITSYLKSVFIEGQHWFFTLFDVVAVILFLWPSVAERLVKDAGLSRAIGVLIFFISFTLANFVTYRKSLHDIDEQSLLFYPYSTGPYLAVELQYIGRDSVKDFACFMSYKDKTGAIQEQRISQFFAKDDNLMAGHSPDLHVLAPNQITRFHLINKESTLDRQVSVRAEFTGVQSNRRVTCHWEIDLDDKSSIQIFI